MGCIGFGGSSATRLVTRQPAPADPRPDHFRVVATKSGNGFVLADVIYPNCTTFEGHKLILFHHVTEAWVRNLTRLDPHFTNNNNIVARFAPTADGRRLANRFLDES